MWKEARMVVELELPYPPSINHYFSYYQGRPVLSKDARTYRHQVRRIAIAKGIKPLMGPIAVRIDIAPPDERRRDCDNVQKAVLDALQHAGAFWDDSQVVWLLTIKHDSQANGRAIVRLDEASSQSPFMLAEVAQG
jgi:crossover junction endodeoxyribonuclease RusA